MANQQLIDYIKAQLAAGSAKADIQRAAMGAKWPLLEIESAFAAAEGRLVAPAPAVQPVAPVVQVTQTQPQLQEKPLPVIHMHPPSGLLRSMWLWASIVILLLVALGAAAYFLTPVGSMIGSYFAPAPVVMAPVATTTPIATEQTYADPVYGISVTYPSTLLRLQNSGDELFALSNFNAAATTSPKAVAACVAHTPASATTTISGISFVVRTATSTASTTVQIYTTAHAGVCFTLEALDSSADPIVQSFRFIATSTEPAASTTVQQ